MRGANLSGADLSKARIAGDLMRANLSGAKLIGADLSADMKNQSMGLMRAACSIPPTSPARTSPAPT